MRNVVLTGFMGSGKTTIGRAVARRLGRPFVDMDAEIVHRAGRSIERIFAEDGEAAFRRLESALCAELSQREGLVIATGGGTLVDPANRAAMRERSVVVCLDCALAEVLDRLGGETSRPLLGGPEPRSAARQLLAARREAYAAIPWHVDTTSLSVDAAAARVADLAGTRTVRCRHPAGRYAIHVGDGLLTHAGGAIRAAGVLERSRVAVVTNTVVGPLWGARLETSLRQAGFEPFTCVIPDGERHKTLATVEALYGQFLAGDLRRSDAVVSLGGGVTGDIAGFAAATFKRGVRFARVPTTLLAMVDASVGGKTGVNLAAGKNLVGAFKQPVAVVVDPRVLATLPAGEVRSGLAEMLKHGLIGDRALFAELEGGPSGSKIAPSSAQIIRALRVKIDIVEGDPFEIRRRVVLNLGHTVGHALERLSGFEMRHGEAVSIGMVAAARISADIGWADRSLVERIEAALSAWGLPVRCPPYEAERIVDALTHDKKERRCGLEWVLPRAVGDVEVTTGVPEAVVKSALRGMGAR